MQTMMVTGATAGIGKATARALAQQGAQVVIVGRNEAKCRATVDELRRAAGHEQIDYLCGDLSRLAETRAIAAQFTQRYGRLDVLVNNVGAIFMSFGETADGIERTFALNHLSGYFLLTTALLDVLRDSVPARVVCVSSNAHRGAALDLDDLEMRRAYRGFRQYGHTKLMNILFAKELSRRLDGTGVTANVLHPGFVASSFGLTSTSRPWVRASMKLLHLFAVGEDQGAQTSVFLATSAEVDGVTGKYFVRCQENAPAAAALNEANQRRLWEASESWIAAKERDGSRT